MATVFEIPLVPRAQILRTEIGGTGYTLRLRWNKPADCWIMDIYDANGQYLTPDGGGLTGIPLVTGTDLMGQFRYLGIGGGVPFTVMTTGLGHSPDEVPTYANLGIDGRLYFTTLT